LVRPVTILLLSGLCTAFGAQEACAQTSAPEVSAFCQSGSAAAMAHAGANSALYQLIWQNCKAGDIIQIPADDLSVISTVCDFSRAVVAIGGRIFCALLSEPRATSIDNKPVAAEAPPPPPPSPTGEPQTWNDLTDYAKNFIPKLKTEYKGFVPMVWGNICNALSKAPCHIAKSQSNLDLASKFGCPVPTGISYTGAPCS
jgi:hypothetical protein